MGKRTWIQAVGLAAAAATAGAVLVIAPASAAGGIGAAFSKGSDWGSGWEGKYTISNNSGSSLPTWTVEFDLPSGHSIASLWDGSYSVSGQHVTVKNTWNGNLSNGGSTSFGFNVKYSGGYVAPANCKLNGGSCDPGGGTPTTTPTTPTTTTSNPPTTTTSNPPLPGGRGAPYLYLGWGSPPNPQTVMNATGIKWFTMAFILSSGGCNPAWDGSRPLQGGVDANAIAQIKAAGGQIVPSFGGWSGNKLGPNCSTPEALAGAYQKVIDAYGLKAIDIDIENTDEFENAVVQDRVLNALKIVKANNPGIQTILTFGTTTSGPNSWGQRLIDQSKALNAGIDVYTIMPFDFGGGADMYGNTISAANGLRDKLKSTFGWNDATAYGHLGISGMNGLSDQRELTSLDTWTRITNWAKTNKIARLAFWSTNRDRGCPNGGVAENCSGIAQNDWDFTRITAGF
ncbi:chitinase [Amycolatopsis regifaucium]|uniref:Chitinase n=1 Tax=Amycolatopsis regifaucium TaxID=546365 RepID=A0A154MH55_9PSEU|nr:cellulose binding domain-containing protein [Amycolatopsis regifaucium]KZB83781.1 chitinase [Amycolatopsis regifaucium]OKA06778.1 chitinase [Amycolatopsis regifaucium]SFH26564.1 Glycosyl hydrolases family 18 [Amycolatopsis regifaucium]